MKKIEAVFLLIGILLISSFVSAQNAEIEKAYDCLEDKVKDKCDDLSVEEQAFTVLATGKCSSELKDKSDDSECWPSGGCRLRDTALAVLAFDRVGKNTGDAEDWLLAQKKTPTDLTWYLEIDADEETTCTINYGSTKKTLSVLENKKIDRNAGTCLTLAKDDYWLKIKNTCYETNFTISCDKDFVTTLLYEKDSTIYVSSQTEFASAEGSTEHTVNSFCFKQGSSCNYEGSLWATLALAKTGNDISEFLPYLIALADENKEFFPSAFLYMITDYDEYFTETIEEQKAEYWKIKDSSYHQFYDTALALLALYGLDAEQIETAKTYLLEVQGDNGCWRNNIRDTAFILYAAWPKSVSAVGGDTDDCEDYDYYCVSPLDCSSENKLDSFYCPGSKVCCKTQPVEETCDEKGGIECSEDQQCTGATVPASDTTRCCRGSCIAKTETTECEDEGFTCRSFCDDDTEIEKSLYDCESGKVCCGSAPVTGKSYWWVWLLVILIILVIIAIFFRNQLRIWLFRIKNKFRKGPAPSRAVPRGYPPAPPGAVRPRARPRMMPGRRIMSPIKRAISKTDKELDETLKKLKEMSK